MPRRALDRRAPCAAALALAAGLAAVLACVAPAAAIAGTNDELRTVGETSAYAKTGRYEEVERLCHAFAAKWPRRVRCVEFGRTPEQRPMLALVASDTGVLDPSKRRPDQPVLLFQGGIHAGEIDGKDAGFKVLQELLEGSAAPDALKHVTIVFVPVYNVDGHERFGRWNRPNQRGPEEMGWRTTAQNFNLNRDYMKADTPEAQAMLRLLGAWDPILYVDLHVTDGAQFQEDISVQVEPAHGWDLELGRTGTAIRDAVVAQLGTEGFRALPFYPSFVTEDDPASGFAVDVSEPRYSTSYWALHNRFGVLVETHSWKEYPRRVAATRATILSMVELAVRDGRQWVAAAQAADERASQLAGKPVVLEWQSGSEIRMIDFAGYAYTRAPSEVSGKTWIRYDETKPETWHVPLRYAVKPALTVVAPEHGYVVPVAYADWMSKQLSLHGVRFEVVRRSEPRVDVQYFLAGSVTAAKSSFEGHVMMTVKGSWQRDVATLPAGSLFVPIAQPESRLLMSLLEPEAPDSYVSWGFFDTAFEPKEYMEDYVAEGVARQMLADDPALRAEFERRLREDPEFAADPKARLDFFFRRHPSWDHRYLVYPVYRR